jgi:mRNA interferase YafQ
MEDLLGSSIALLAEDRPLPAKNRDHVLTGEWDDFRECHLKPDLLLIYRRIAEMFCN